jgi:glycosyltransferase involved in cell wall biosynthesis
MSNPLVSIIINCYNGEKYLSEAIKSILCQTYKNFEIIFWDNKSKDNSERIYKNFNDKRLRYFYSETHTSLYEAKNLAIRKSKGDFIAFLDVDDYWEKNKLYKQVKKLKNKKVDLVYSNYFNLNQFTGLKKKAYNKKLPEGIIFKKLLNQYFIGIGTVLMKREVFFKNKEFFNKKYNIIGDFDFFVRISKKFFFASIQSPLLTYRIHNKSFSHNNYKIYIKEFKYWFKNQSIDCSDKFFYAIEKTLYMEAIINIFNRNYTLFIKKIYQIHSYKKKIKLLIFFLIPNFFLKKLINNFS